MRLHQVADVRVVEDPAVLRHESVSRYVDVGADLSGDRDRILADVRQRHRGGQVPARHHAELRGASVEDEGGRSTLFAVTITAALAIFLLLQAAFTSWRLAALAFVMLPLAAVGGLVAIALDGGEVGIGAFAGLLAVSGITARSVILMLHRYQDLERREGDAFGDELVLRGTQERFVETLVTTVGTILVLLPVLAAGDIAGLEIARPMAFVMIGGIVASTLLVLLALPALYRMQVRRSPGHRR